MTRDAASPTRRQLLTGTASLAMSALAPSALATAGEVTIRAQTFLDHLTDRILAWYPENATQLGIDTGRHAGLRAKLADRSLAGIEVQRGVVKEQLAAVKALERNGLSAEMQANLEVAQATLELSATGHGFRFGDMALLNQSYSYRNSPYAVAQNIGAFVEVPDFLTSQHKIEAQEDADSYLSRLTQYAVVLDAETERLRVEGGQGVTLPGFLLDKAIGQFTRTTAAPVAEWEIVKHFEAGAKQVGHARPGEALSIVTDKVLPALKRQQAVMEEQRRTARGEAGVWALPQGADYYAWALSAATTTTLSPDEVHAMGLEQLKMLQSCMEPLLRAQGLTQGTVGERMAALGKDPRYLWPNDEKGRADLLAYINGLVDDIRTRMPQAFTVLVPGRLVVKRVPVSIEAGAPGGYASAGSMDGSQPGSYYINLRDTTIWPRHALPTLSYHEGIPGHIWQGEYSYKLPLIRTLLAYSAYTEGWALYAEQLADELGVYKEDPVGQLGYLQSMAFRACRLVVDTGIHAKRWTREQAIDWFATNNGSTRTQVTGEVDRYCSWPGQACAYKIGHTAINRVRDNLKAKLGVKYDFRRFNDALVMTGNVPLSRLEALVEGRLTA
ncbi:DUF885 domain-containing protein [Niveispirillum lacus]|uniref:DUF885 domain-containing protein n=1 Tax=Niveispirillum lacus TaxID=1981099 RepID=A0A255Z5W5_9PROT|nr:DUF885 family protein [Niveispirillum lacus]OYQ36923.1 DUF885 domain-containing protein [Niveispirillum lacus]